MERKTTAKKIISMALALLLTLNLFPVTGTYALATDAMTPEDLIEAVVEATETPTPTAEISETPETEMLTSTEETPAPTDAPAEETPTATEAPEVTETPAATDAPETSETPAPTETPTPTETPEPTETPDAEKSVTAWSWNDDMEMIDPDTGIVEIGDVNEEAPLSFDDILEYLPLSITAEVNGEAETLPVSWSCDTFPAQATTGEYVFTAALPEGYVLGEGAALLCLTVSLVAAEPELPRYSEQSDPDNAIGWREKAEAVGLTGQWGSDLVAIAQTQLGYSESSIDYYLDEEGLQHGWSIYGDWYGDDYGDWCAMFIAWCLDVAGIEPADYPVSCGCNKLKEAIAEFDAYESGEDYIPQPGDLVFFHVDSENANWADHVGIVESVQDGVLTTIEGNNLDQVLRAEYNLNETSNILGYANTGSLMAQAMARKGGVITAWSWVDEWEIVDAEIGVATIPGVSASNPIDFDTLVSFLPAYITATVNDESVEVPVSWRCAQFGGSETEGSYVFAASFSDAYTLGEEVDEPVLVVELGGAAVMADTPTYISQIALSTHRTNAGKSKKQLTDKGFTVVNVNLNEGTTGSRVYLGYKTTTDPTKAITGMVIRIGENPPESLTYGGYTYYLVGGNKETNATGKGAVNLNNWTPTGDHIYLYVTRERDDQYRSRIPLTGIGVFWNGSQADKAGMEDITYFANNNRWANLNEGTAIGDTLYLYWSEIYEYFDIWVCYLDDDGYRKQEYYSVQFADHTQQSEWTEEIPDKITIGEDVYALLGYTQDTNSTEDLAEIPVVHYGDDFEYWYAVYRANIGLKFDANGGDGAPEDELEICTFVSNVSIEGQLEAMDITHTIPDVEPTHADKCAFLGWADNADATEANSAYAAGTTLTLTGSKTLYAVYAEHTYDERGICTECGKYQPATVGTDGTVSIANAGQLLWFAGHVNGDTSMCVSPDSSVTSASNAVLTADIDLKGLDWTPIGKYTSDSEYVSYSGSFDGKLHRIKNLTISTTDKLMGLFGVVGDGAVISRVIMDASCSISGGDYVAALVGGSMEAGNVTIKQCGNEAAVSGGKNAAGIYGVNSGSNATVTIEDCYNIGNITADNEGGAIAGWVGNGAVQDCFNMGTVSGTDSDSFARGSSSASFSNCYNLSTLTVSGNNVTAKTASAFSSGEVAYLLAHRVVNGSQVWYQDIDNGVTPYDAYPMFEGGTVYSSAAACTQDATYYSNTSIADDHSFLHGFCRGCGLYEPATVTNKRAYIANAGQLYWFAAHVNGDTSNCYQPDTSFGDVYLCILTADIDMSVTPDGVKWTPIGVDEDHAFTETFDGQYYTISNLTCDDSTYGVAGLFGYNKGTIQAVGLIDAEVASYNGVSASLVGYTYGPILCCWSENADVTPSGIKGVSGGLVGYCLGGGSIDLSWTSGYVLGWDDAGGLCGYLDFNAEITNCFSAASGTCVNNSYYSALVGYGYGGTVERSYCLDGRGCGRIMATTTKDVETKSEAQFASGEVAYLLNNRYDSDGVLSRVYHFFYQVIDSGVPEALPHLIEAEQNTVYDFTACDSQMHYSNYDYEDNTHLFDNGFCRWCGKYERPYLTGTAYNDTIQIRNGGQLMWYAAHINGDTSNCVDPYDGRITALDGAVLMNDVYVNEDVDKVEGRISWTPMGTYSEPYPDTFEGNGHSISGLYHEGTGASAFIGYSGEGAIVQNLTIKDSYFSCTGGDEDMNHIYLQEGTAGTFVGGMKGASTVKNCVSSGNTVKSIGNVGGIVGVLCDTDYNHCYVEDCTNYSDVYGLQVTDQDEGTYAAGGIVGGYVAGTIKNCTNYGSVSNSYRFSGGVVGFVAKEDLSLVKCANYGTVSSKLGSGGIVGMGNAMTIDNCYNQGKILDGSNSGDAREFVYGIYNSRSVSVTIKNSYGAAATDSSGNLGFSNSSSYENCYTNREDFAATNLTYKTENQFASGEVTYLLNNGTTDGTQVWYQDVDNGETPYDAYPLFAGGTVYGMITNCKRPEDLTYSNTEFLSDGHVYSGHGFCVNTDDEGNACGHYEPAVVVTATNCADLNLDESYAGYYAISNVGQLYWAAALVNGHAPNPTNSGTALTRVADANFVLCEDIDLSEAPDGLTWTPMGFYDQENSVLTYYSGTFDGNRHIVRNMSVHSSGYAGFFGYAMDNTIKDLGVFGTVDSTDDPAGVFAGELRYTTVSDCFAVGTATTGDSHIGAFVGRGNNATLSNCFAYDEANGLPFLYISSYATLTNCYYLASESSDSGKTAGQFASGEVAWLLNNGATDGSQAWYQDIDNGETPYDTYPMFSGGTVYGLLTCQAQPYKYSNSADMEADVYHSFDEHGFCQNYTEADGVKTYCHAYEPAQLRYEYALIENEGQLYWFAAHVNNSDPTADAHVDARTANAEVTNSTSAMLIDSVDLANVPEEITWTPIGVSGRDFQGSFYSEDETISNFDFAGYQADGIHYVDGLFGYVNGGTIADFTVTGNMDITIDGGGNSSFGLIGWASGATTIENVHSAVNINLSGLAADKANVGGLVGYIDADTSISGCTYSGTITGAAGQSLTGVGGMAGTVASGKTLTVTNSSFTGKITAGSGAKLDSIGGVVGNVYGTVNVSGCKFAGSISDGAGTDGAVKTMNFAGGIVGQVQANASATISHCTFTSDASISGTQAEKLGGMVGGTQRASTVNISECDVWGKITVALQMATSDGQYGGIVSYVYPSASYTIEDCGWYGSISSTTNVAPSMTGGILGYHRDADGSGTTNIIRNCLSVGSFSGTDTTTTGAIGGILRNDGATITVTNCYYLDSIGSAVGIGGNNDDVNSGFTAKTAGELATGEVTWLLNEQLPAYEGDNTALDSLVWHQDIDVDPKDPYPIFDAHVVYPTVDTDNNPTGSYYNQKVVSVDIVYGGMCFTYNTGLWDPNTHSYSNEGWLLDHKEGDLIQVTNVGTVDVNVNIGIEEAHELTAEELDLEEGEETLADDGITVALDGWKKNGSAITAPTGTEMLVHNDVVQTQVTVTGKPNETFDGEGQLIGRVTVSLSLPTSD